jgi:FtsZ-binding cell division protein ZapB
MTKGICTLQLNSISKVDDDPLLIKATYSILDFSVSGNRQIVPKDLAIEASPTLKGKPLLCVYTPNTSTDTNMMNDHFNDHGDMQKTDRYGNQYIGSDSIAIGTALEGGYIGKIKNKDGNEIEALLCDFYLWADRNIEILQLIVEMHENGLPLYSSCEFYYKNYTVNEGVQTIQSPLIFSGHAILSSGENGSTSVAPAYDSSKLISLNERWNKAVAQAIVNQNSPSENVDINNNVKEDKPLEENLFYKAICELSHGDIREQIMTALSKTMTADEFRYVWLSNYGIYDTYFVYENYINDNYVNFKVPYTKTDTEVVIDFENKVQVVRDSVWVEVSVMEQSVNELNTQIEDLTGQINTANETINTLTTEKEALTEQFNNATETIVSLNAKVEELTPVVEQYNSELLEKAINSKKEYYSVKFKAVNAVEKFYSDEVQALIMKSINDDDEGKNAILSLNTMLVDMVQVKSDDKQPTVKEVASKQANLIPTGNDFESRYGI